MNRLFLLIPAVGEQDAADDISYLKMIGNVDKNSFIDIFRKINQSQKLIKEEEVVFYYDDNHFKALVNTAKTALSDSEEMPQLENLLVFFDDKKSIQKEKIGLSPIKVYEVDVKNGLLNAFMEGGPNEADALLNREALNYPNRPLEIKKPDGDNVSIKPLYCNQEDIYLWLVSHRSPRRNIDPNAKKHKRKVSYGKRGKVSPITYSIDQLNVFLQKAVPAQKGRRELYYKDVKKDNIIIFWDENVTELYHAFETKADDQEEIQKIYKRGKKELFERIEATAVL